MLTENKSNEKREMDAVREKKLKNINLLMMHSNIPNYTILSKALGIKPTTWHSYLNTLSDKSKVESMLCDYFGITVYEFQNEDLSENGYLNRELPNKTTNASCNSDENVLHNCNSGSLISSLSDLDVYNDIINSCCSELENDELLAIKRKLIKKYNMMFFTRISEARLLFSKGEYIKATNLYDSAWAVMDHQAVKSLKVDDFVDYIYASKIVGNDNGISALVDKLKSGAFEDKVTLIVANSLEKHFPEYAKKCYLNLL